MARHLVSDTYDNLEYMVDNNQITEPYVVYVTDEDYVGWNTLENTTPSPAPTDPTDCLRMEYISGDGLITVGVDNMDGQMDECIEELYYRSGYTDEYTGEDVYGDWVAIKESGVPFDQMDWWDGSNGEFLVRMDDYQWYPGGYFVEFKGVTHGFETGSAHLFIQPDYTTVKLSGNIQSVHNWRNMSESAVTEYFGDGFQCMPFFSMFGWSGEFDNDSSLIIPYKEMPDGLGVIFNDNFQTVNTGTIYCDYDGFMDYQYELMGIFYGYSPDVPWYYVDKDDHSNILYDPTM